MAQDAPTFALFLHYNMAWGQPQQITVLMLGVYQAFKSDGAGQKKLAFICFKGCRLCLSSGLLSSDATDFSMAYAAMHGNEYSPERYVRIRCLRGFLLHCWLAESKKRNCRIRNKMRTCKSWKCLVGEVFYLSFLFFIYMDDMNK